MSAKERLQTVQAALQERGAKDVKFFVERRNASTLTKLSYDMADLLEAVIQGNTKPLPPAGDMPQLRAGKTLTRPVVAG